jgi:hypothetical protein
MRILVAAVIASCLTPSVKQFAPPDISGSWECVGCVADSLDPTLRPAWGAAPVITFEYMKMLVRFTFPVNGRGGVVEQRPVDLLFGFDGARSNESKIASSGSNTNLWDVTT